MTKEHGDEHEAASVLRDPLIEDLIQEALAPYIHVAPPELLQAMRRQIEWALLEEPYPKSLVRALGVRPARASTEEVPVGGSEASGGEGSEASEATPAKSGRGRGA